MKKGKHHGQMLGCLSTTRENFQADDERLCRFIDDFGKVPFVFSSWQTTCRLLREIMGYWPSRPVLPSPACSVPNGKPECHARVRRFFFAAHNLQLNAAFTSRFLE